MDRHLIDIKSSQLPFMPQISLVILKKGLATLQKQVSAKQKDLSARLRWKEKLSEVDEQWLDNEGNTIDEELLCDKLENASDYELWLESLDSREKEIVERLTKLGGEILSPVGKEWKHTCQTFFGGLSSKQWPQDLRIQSQQPWKKQDNLCLLLNL